MSLAIHSSLFIMHHIAYLVMEHAVGRLEGSTFCEGFGWGEVVHFLLYVKERATEIHSSISICAPSIYKQTILSFLFSHKILNRG